MVSPCFIAAFTEHDNLLFFSRNPSLTCNLHHTVSQMHLSTWRWTSATKANSPRNSVAPVLCLLPLTCHFLPQQNVSSQFWSSQYACVPSLALAVSFLAPVSCVQVPSIYFQLRKSYDIKLTSPALEQISFWAPPFQLMFLLFFLSIRITLLSISKDLLNGGDKFGALRKYKSLQVLHLKKVLRNTKGHYRSGSPKLASYELNQFDPHSVLRI